MTKITYNIGDKGWKKHFPHFKKYIGQAVNETHKQMDIKIDEDIVVSIFLTSNNEIKKLNNQYRNKNKPTNVLSFPMQSTSDGIYLLGDIVLSNQFLLEESIEQKVKKYDHLCKMTIHGMLHLGWYLDGSNAEFKEMKSLQEIILDSCLRVS